MRVRIYLRTSIISPCASGLVCARLCCKISAPRLTPSARAGCILRIHLLITYAWSIGYQTRGDENGLLRIKHFSFNLLKNYIILQLIDLILFLYVVDV